MAWLGQKPDPEPTRPTPPATAWSPQVAAPSFPRESREKTEMTNVANIGKSLHIKGELSGNEDLTIEGKVDGKITLIGHSVTIGENGLVMAEIQAKSVVVGGQVRGNITADDRVEVAPTGTMLGDVRAPRVVLADGAQFKGSIDMDTKSGSGARAAAGSASKFTGSPAPSHNETPMSVGATKS